MDLWTLNPRVRRFREAGADQSPPPGIRTIPCSPWTTGETSKCSR
jgi:hypothetical protein